MNSLGILETSLSGLSTRKERSIRKSTISTLDSAKSVMDLTSRYCMSIIIITTHKDDDKHYKYQNFFSFRKKWNGTQKKIKDFFGEGLFAIFYWQHFFYEIFQKKENVHKSFFIGGPWWLWGEGEGKLKCLFFSLPIFFFIHIRFIVALYKYLGLLK